MALITNAIKGTLDLLPAESYKTQYVEAAVREIADRKSTRLNSSHDE